MGISEYVLQNIRRLDRYSEITPTAAKLLTVDSNDSSTERGFHPRICTARSLLMSLAFPSSEVKDASAGWRFAARRTSQFGS